MTISSQTRKAGPFTGDGVTTAYPFAFKVFDEADVLVAKLVSATSIETTLTLTTDYTVALNSNQNANPGGTVTLVTPLAVGTSMVLGSSLDYLQPTELTNQGGFYPRVITDALDRLTILAQQLKEEVDRSAKVPITSTTDADTLVNNINNLAAQFGGITTVATSYETLSGTGAQQDFTLSAAPASLGAVEAFVAGAAQRPGIDFTVNGTTLSFTVAPASGTDNILVRWISAQATTTIDDGSVTTAKIAPSAVVTSKIAVKAITTGRLDDGAVTSIKLDPAGVVLPSGSTVYVPDPADDSAKPAPTQWVRDYVAPLVSDSITAAKVGYLEYRDQKAAGTHGGDAVSGSWVTRDINTEHADSGGHGSVSANQITLAAGTYYCEIRVPAYAVGRHQSRLRNITDSATTLVGSSAVTVSTATNQSDSFITGQFTIAGATVFEVQNRVASSQTNGLGTAANFGETEIYTVARFWKVG